MRNATAMTHPSRVLNLGHESKALYESYIYIYIYIYILYIYIYIYIYVFSHSRPFHQVLEASNWKPKAYTSLQTFNQKTVFLYFNVFKYFF